MNIYSKIKAAICICTCVYLACGSKYVYLGDLVRIYRFENFSTFRHTHLWELAFFLELGNDLNQSRNQRYFWIKREKILFMKAYFSKTKRGGIWIKSKMINGFQRHFNEGAFARFNIQHWNIFRNSDSHFPPQQITWSSFVATKAQRGTPRSSAESNGRQSHSKNQEWKC